MAGKNGMVGTICERFERNVDISDGGCWDWTGGKSGTGYGGFWVAGRALLPHRWSYERSKGPIPSGMTIDHLCRNRGCVNPDHLEAVTCGENILRGTSVAAVNAKKTHCPHGHEYTPTNTRIAGYKRGRPLRGCRACHNAQARARHRTVKV